MFKNVSQWHGTKAEPSSRLAAAARTRCGAIARVTEIDHTTIINWVEEAGESLSDELQDEEIPEITEIDELQTFVGNKNNKLWIWTVVNHQKKGTILWNIGDRSHESFEPIWQIIKCWHSFWYVTDGWKVYPMYIQSEDHLISKTYMTRVEGENTRFRHCALERTDSLRLANRHTSARLHRKILCYSKSILLLKYSLGLLFHYLRFGALQFSF